MRFDIKSRRIELSAQEFATFRPGPGAGAGGAPWRAEAGRQWHETLRRQAEAEQDHWTFEQAANCELQALGWRLVITGRADQWRAVDGAVRVREIKTVSTSLPRRPDQLVNVTRITSCNCPSIARRRGSTPPSGRCKARSCSST